MDGIVRRKVKTFSRAKPQRPQRTAKTKEQKGLFFIQDLQAFLCELCGFARK
jgi:hypothetical protein